MNITELIAQGIGLVAMVCNILSYQGKNQKSVLALQLIGNSLFAANYLLLGATVGAILNVIGTIRALVFLKKDTFKADHLAWLFFFGATYISVYILNFTLLGKEPTAKNLILEILPVIGMFALNIGYRLKEASAIRKCGLISSPAWLIYNLSVGSWGAILCEIFTLISIFVGMLRHDSKRSNHAK